jgi:hypothetical protein
MKKLPDEDRLMKRMAPGVLCRDGFLGHDHRTLHEIIENDAHELDHLGVTTEQLADEMERILDAAEGTFGAPVTVTTAGGRGLVATYRESMGKIPSPWGGAVFRKGEVELADPKSGEILQRYTPLSVHLVREHGFFQGRGSRYRIEPDRFVELLGLRPQEPTDTPPETP